MDTIDVDKKTSYINFKIGKENFAISVHRVLEIIQLDHVTNIPNSSKYVMGVLNFRGSVVPVINMHQRFNLNTDDSGRIVIVVEVKKDNKRILLGLQVREVTDVIEFNFKSIRAVPEVGIKHNREFLEGIVEVNKEFVFILNMDEVLDLTELSELEDMVNN